MSLTALTSRLSSVCKQTHPTGRRPLRRSLRLLERLEDRNLLTVMNFDYVDAATAVDIGPQDGVFDAFTEANFGSVVNNGFTSFRTAIEFDISTIPAGAVINAATLTLRGSIFEGPREVALHGYAGDGTVQLEDFSLDGLVDNTTLVVTCGGRASFW